MTNKEFLFIFDAAMTNPNGDPDQENKPRMDRATKTNLVTDTRLKRNIRDYLITKFNGGNTDNDIFVRMMGENKVSVETRLLGIVIDFLQDKEKLDALKKKNSSLTDAFAKLRITKDKGTKDDGDSSEAVSENNEPKKGKVKMKAEPFKGDDFELYHSYRKNKPLNEFIISKDAKPVGDIHNEILMAVIKNTMIDSRFFGGAFAVGGFSKTVIGPIQINTGYSFHPVELNPSNTIVTIMGDKEGESGIGKKETLFYSLIGHTGTINAKRASIVDLTDSDLDLFRESIILSMLDWRTDSKKNQYPRLYLEIDYNENEIYGRLDDLRNLIDVTTLESDENFLKVRSIRQVKIDFANLVSGIEKINNRIEKIRIWTSLDGTCNELIIKLEEKFGKEKIQKLEI